MDKGASPSGDRAVVNGAASVSAVPASAPSADEVLTAHLTVYGEADDILPPNVCEMLTDASERIKQLRSALVIAENAIARIVEGDGGMSVESCWNVDGKPSKHDRCEHGRYMYEGCQTCCDAALDLVLENVLRPTLAAQAIEARRAEAGTGSVHESAVAKPCAQTTPGDPQ